MDGSICIVTPSGMKCSSSPIVRYGPRVGRIKFPDTVVVRAMRKVLRPHMDDDLAEIVATVAALLDASAAHGKTPFAIWRNPFGKVVLDVKAVRAGKGRRARR